jgi:hypothetical protein
MKSKSITQLATGLTLWVWLGLLSSAQAQLTAIAEQDFSGDFSSGWAFTPDPATYNTGSDIWDTVSALSSINPVVGTYFWGMQDLDNPNGGGAFWHTSRSLRKILQVFQTLKCILTTIPLATIHPMNWPT